MNNIIIDEYPERLLHLKNYFFVPGTELTKKNKLIFRAFHIDELMINGICFIGDRHITKLSDTELLICYDKYIYLKETD